MSLWVGASNGYSNCGVGVCVGHVSPVPGYTINLLLFDDVNYLQWFLQLGEQNPTEKNLFVLIWLYSH